MDRSPPRNQRHSAAPIEVFVMWRRRSTLPGASRHSSDVLAYHYDAPVPPARPLKPGVDVRLVLLTNARLHTPSLPAEPPQYEVTSYTGVEGPISRITAANEDILVFLVANAAAGRDLSPVAYAFVSVPNARGSCVDVGPEQIPLAALRPQPLHATRACRQAGRAVLRYRDCQCCRGPGMEGSAVCVPLHYRFWDTRPDADSRDLLDVIRRVSKAVAQGGGVREEQIEWWGELNEMCTAILG
ncbi:hypothetical protein C8Q80DRAFT_1137976 [Daedaleopsis nitida]|nr:hypothetical protein C8Q80DRAFT_1137976 [Daedaleopsis nitida]